MCMVAVHDVGDASFAVQARAGANQLEADVVGPLRQAHMPAEGRRQRAFDDRCLLLRVEDAVDPETLDVVRDELGGHDAVGSICYPIQKRAADDENERGGEGEGAYATSPGARMAEA